MAVTTSQVTTASNGDLAISPNGSGKIKFSKLTGGSLPTGVLTDGTVQHFRVDQLSGATGLAANTVVMVQKNGETVVKKSSLADVVSAGGGVKLTDFSVATGAATAGGALAYNNTSGVFTFNPADLSDLIGLGSLSVSTGTASGGGSLSYNNSNGVFTFQPTKLSDLGGITLGSLSVSTGSAQGGGELSYNNSNGVFTYKPAKLSDLGGITLGSLSVSVAAASGGGSLSYNSTNGVFTFAPADLSGLGGGGGTTYSGANGIGFVGGSSTQFEIKINSLSSR